MGFFDLNKKGNSDTKTGFFDTPETPGINSVAESEATSLFERFKDKINTPTGKAIKSGISSVVAPKINAVKQVFNLPKFINPILEKPRNIEQNKVEAYRKASDIGIVPPIQQNVDQNFEYRKSLEEGSGKVASTDVGVGISQGTRGTRIVAPYAAAYNYISGKEDGDYIDVYNKTIQNIDRKMQDPNNSFGENFLFSFADSVPQTLVGSALSLIPVVGKPLSTAFFGLVSAESQMREKGKVSAPNVVIDTLGDRLLGANIEKLLATPTQELIKSGMWGYVKRQGKQGLVEGVTEPSQTILKYVSDYKDAKTPEQKQTILTEAKDYVLKGGLLMESLVGFSAGFLISGGVESLNTQQKKKMEETIKNIHPEKDGDFTEPQNKVRKAFRQQVLYALSKNNWDTEKASQEISNNTGINIEVAQKMVSELSQNSEFLFSIMKDTADQFINPQENIYKDQLEEIAQEVSPQFNYKKAPETTPEDALMEEAKKYKTADEFVGAQIKAFHGTNDNFRVFNPKKGSQGVIWFTDNAEKIKAGTSGAQGTRIIMDRYLTGKKFAGWDEYEKLTLGQIEQQGFDGIKLPDGDGGNDYILFENKSIKTLKQLKEIWNKATGKESSQVETNLNSENFGSGQPSDIKGSKRYESTKGKGFDNYQTGGQEKIIRDSNGNLRFENNQPSFNAKSETVKSPQFKKWFGDFKNDPKNASKIVDENGEPLVVYHGTNSSEFEVFDKKYIGNRDSGWFGKGFYFALTKGEAGTYGRNVVPVYLNIRNPFDFSSYYKGIEDFKGYGYTDTYVLAKMSEDVPGLNTAIKGTIYKKGNESTDFKRIGQDVTLGSYKKMVENENLTPKPTKIEDRGKTTISYKYKDIYGGEQWYDTYGDKPIPNELLKYVIFDKKYQTDFDVGGLYGVERKIADSYGDQFTKELKDLGYDGTMQSPDGDEYVAFEPNQIKAAEGNTTFDATNDSIKFNKKGSRITLPEVEANPENAKKLMKQNGVIGVDPKLVEVILTPEGKRAYGVYVGGTLSLERFVQAFTEEHEVFHLLFQNMEKFGQFKNFDKKALFDEARSLYGEDLTDAQLEEEMAVDFQQYLYERQNNQPSSFFGLIKETFERWFAILKRAFTQQNNINELYRTITEGKAKAQTFIPNVMPASFNRKVREGIVDFRTQKATGDFLKGKLVSDVFTDSGDLTLKTITKLEGRKTVSKQYVIDISKQQGISKPETELINAMLATEGDTINVADFVARVKDELLPLTRNSTDIEFNGEFDDNPFAQSSQPAYENIVLPEEIRGNVKNYIENVYESPIHTSAGDTHFRNSKLNTGNYFGHTRIEDMQDEELRRVIEVQSDLYQKGNLEKELDTPERVLNSKEFAELKNLYKERTAIENQTDIKDIKSYTKKVKEIATQERALQDKIKYAPTDRELSNAKLQQYNDPTAHFRMIREEIKRAAQDGKTRLQFPMGETAMKIEGLSRPEQWSIMPESGIRSGNDILSPEKMKVGTEVYMTNNAGDNWIITDVLGDGKFKAVPKDLVVTGRQGNATAQIGNQNQFYSTGMTEEFDISGKIDTNNPIYKFYEKDVQKYLKNNYDAVPVTDDQGVSWMEVPINSYMAYQPVPAFNLKPEYDEFGEPVLRYDEEEEIPIQKNPPVATAKEALDLAEKRVGVKPTDIPKLKNKLNRVEMSLRAAQANPEAHKKAYGKDKIPEYLEEIADTEEKINQIEKINTPKVRSIAKSKIKLSPELEQKQNTLDSLSMQIAMSEEFLKEHPGRNLMKFLSKKEGTFIDMENPYEDALGNKRTEAETRRVLERNKRIQNAAQVAFTESSQEELGDKFDSSDAVREQIEDYQLAQQNIKNLKEQRKDLRKQFYAERNLYYLEERDRYVLDNFISKQERLNVLDEVAKILRKEGKARMDQVKDIQEYFMLDDAEMKKVMKGKPDLRLLSDAEYENILKAIQGQAYAEMAHREALFAVRNTIHEMDLKKVENLREAMKMKEFKNMTVNELNQFNDLLQTFQKGDIFLGKRQIQTAGLTDLGDIKTHREVLEKLVKESGLPIETIKNIQIKEVDKFLYDTALARKNPLYKIMVDNYQMEQAKSAIRLGEIRNKTNELFKKARLSRPRRFVDKLVPTDEVIFRYLESTPEDQQKMQKNMTTAEIAAATYVQQQYEYIRDYLVKQGTLKNYRESYVTHIRRSLLESIKEHGGNIFKGGLKQIVKEVLDVHKQERANFNILNDKTGDVLPLEKFFKYSMRRTDNLIPSKNVAKAFLSYMETFEKKRALDSFVPKIDIFVHVLTPQEETEKGLIKDETIKTFVRKWLNTKRGRVVDTGVISPGDKIDTGIRSLIATLRVMQLGLNIPTGLGSMAGAHMATYYGTGSKKFVLGTARSYSKKGKEIGEKYEKILGERIFKRLQDASFDIGDKGNALMFVLFSEADRKAKTVFLLGNMTKEEFQKGELSDARLKEIFTDMSEFHKMDNFESVLGKTAIGKMFTTYKGWAVPLFHTTIRNMEKTVSELKKGNNPLKTKEGRQMLRFTIMNTVLLLLTYGVYRELRDDKERTFMEQLAYKALNDAYSLIGALDPTFWTNSGALVGFLTDLVGNLTQIVQSITLDDKTASGEIRGLKNLKKQVTPQLLKQFVRETPEDKLDISIMTSVTKAQKELDALDDDIAEAGTNAWEKVKDLPKGDPKRREIVNGLTDLEFEALKKARSADEEYQQELYKKVVPIVDKVEEVGKTAETRAMVNKLTDEEFEAYKKAKKTLYGVDIDVPEAKVLKEGEKQFGPSTEREVYDKQNIITKIWNGAQALGTDPVDFFDALIHGGYEFMGTKGGQLIIARMKEEDSEAIKKQSGVTSSNKSEWRLDHIVPLTAGGLNKRSNLQLIPTSQWSSNTRLEVAIGRALYEKKITGREAREYVIRYKAGKGQKLSQETLKEYKKKYNSQPLTEQQILELISK